MYMVQKTPSCTINCNLNNATTINCNLNNARQLIYRGFLMLKKKLVCSSSCREELLALASTQRFWLLFHRFLT